MRRLALLLVILSLAVPAWAQDRGGQPAPASESTIDATKLGVSLSRIKKGLRTLETRDERSGSPLRLEFQVRVYGTAPRIDVLGGVDLMYGDSPGSAPTHRQIIEFVTPVIYRTPVMPLSALGGWVVSHLWQRSKKADCEAEIANYRALVMQGVSVSAPRCTQ